MSFKKTPKQCDATLLHAGSAVHVMLYGGSRSGKTFIAVRNIVIRALKCKSRHLIARLRFNHVKISIWHDTFPKVMKLCFPNVRFIPNKTDYFIKFPNGSEIWFGGLDEKERAEKVLGNEYSTVFINECSQVSYEAVNLLITRLAEKTKLRTKAYYDCNPASTKHWSYKVFIEHKDPVSNKDLNPDLYASMIMNPKDNVENLADGYIENILGSLSEKQRRRFEDGLFSNDIEGALWTQDMIIAATAHLEIEPDETVVGVDPAVTENEDSDLTGIVVSSKKVLDDGYEYSVDADYSLKASPKKWGRACVNAFHRHDADRIVVEVNQGGDMCKAIIHNIDPDIPVRTVRASKGKFARAEPISLLYERNLVHHTQGLDKLETELMEYVPLTSKKSPDRLDALVWGLTDLSKNNAVNYIVD